MTIKIGLTRQENETWLEAALRYAKPWGLENEIKMTYEQQIELGATEADAALEAVCSWDVAEIHHDSE